MTKRRRILFVDDEPNIIDGLRRMLRDQRRIWDMAFATSGAEALALMDEQTFDVIVADMAMPEMSGAELLELVLHDHPGAARIVLSGHADETSTRRAAELAHQYLSKPIDPDSLKQAIDHACRMKNLIANENVRAAVGGCQVLPSLPDLYFEIIEAVESETSNSHSIAEIISRDVAMSAKILQLVNSSFFGVGRRISSVEQTVTLLGLMRIKALVLSDHVFQEFRPHRRLPSFSITGLWQHSLAVAETARRISLAEHQTEDRPDQAFTAGLLHDVGILILATRNPDGFQALVETVQVCPDDSAEEHERALFGATHADVGAYLLGLWGLPARIVEAVALHHCPHELPYDGLCAVTAVHAAEGLLEEEGLAEASLHGYPATMTMRRDYLERVGVLDRLDAWRSLAREAHSTLPMELVQ